MMCNRCRNSDASASVDGDAMTEMMEVGHAAVQVSRNLRVAQLCHAACVAVSFFIRFHLRFLASEIRIKMFEENLVMPGKES